MADVTRTTPADALPELLLVGEAAIWLGIGKTLAYKMVKDSVLPSVTLGRLVRVRREGLIRLASGERREGGE